MAKSSRAPSPDLKEHCLRHTPDTLPLHGFAYHASASNHQASVNTTTVRKKASAIAAHTRCLNHDKSRAESHLGCAKCDKRVFGQKKAASSLLSRDLRKIKMHIKTNQCRHAYMQHVTVPVQRLNELLHVVKARRSQSVHVAKIVGL